MLIIEIFIIYIVINISSKIIEVYCTALSELNYLSKHFDKLNRSIVRAANF